MGYCRITSSQKQSMKQHVTASPSGNPVFCKAKIVLFHFQNTLSTFFWDWPQTGRLFSLPIMEIPKDNLKIWRDILQVQCNIGMGHGKQKLYSYLMSHPAIQTIFLGFYQNEDVLKYIFRQ